ncbi:MAG: hypothetical protein ACW98F_07900 [Candidatus Hodarchaeales archaeon]|jgi:hypothetical protein
MEEFQIKGNKSNYFILSIVLLISSSYIVLTLLLDTKNFHRIPIPSLNLIELIFSIIVLSILLFFYYNQPQESEITNTGILIFVSTLLNGISIISSNLIVDNFFTPLILYLGVVLQIMLLFYLGVSFKKSDLFYFPNRRLIILLVCIGLMSIFFNRVLIISHLSDVSLYFLLFGNYLLLFTMIIFTATILSKRFLVENKYIWKFLLLFLFPLIVGLLISFVLLKQDLANRILSTVLSQTLNITIFSEVPGIPFSLHFFSLMLTIGAILLTATGYSVLFTSSNDKNLVLWLLVLILLGFEIFTPFKNVIRIIAFYYITVNP